MDTHMLLDNEVPKGVHADHLGIVQFENDDDETFLHVCQYISEAVEQKASVSPPPSTPPPPYSLPLQPSEQWAARDKMSRDMARAIGAIYDGRPVLLSPSPARRPATTTAGQHSPMTTPVLLLDPPSREPKPWEMGRREEEKVAIPVGRPRGRIWDAEEEDDDEEIAHAPVRPPRRQPLLWDQKKDDRTAAPVFTPTPVREQIIWGGEKQDEGRTESSWATDACVSDEEVEDDDDLSESEVVGPLLVHDGRKEAGVYFGGKNTPVTVAAVEGRKEIPAQYPRSRTRADDKIPTVVTRAVGGGPERGADKGVSGGGYGGMFGAFSKMWYSLGRV